MALRDPSYQVVEAVAQREGVSPGELSPPLFSVVDPESLDALAQRSEDANGTSIEIAFTYLDYVVRVRASPTVSVSVETRDEAVDDPGPLSGH